jgi:hypothetical protein
LGEGLLATGWSLLHLPNLDASRQFFVSGQPPTEEQALRLALVNISDFDLEVYGGPSAAKLFQEIPGRTEQRADFEKFKTFAACLSVASDALYARELPKDEGAPSADAAARIRMKLLDLGFVRSRSEITADPLGIQDFRLMARGATTKR